MENCLLRCNLRFINLPENAEGSDSPGFLENLLTTTYDRKAFSVMFAVERAHRIPAWPPPKGAPSHTFVAKFLNFKDCNKILCLTREKCQIPFNNVHVAVFPDFSNEVQRQWSWFQVVKQRLRILHLKYTNVVSCLPESWRRRTCPIFWSPWLSLLLVRSMCLPWLIFFSLWDTLWVPLFLTLLRGRDFFYFFISPFPFLYIPITQLLLPRGISYPDIMPIFRYHGLTMESTPGNQDFCLFLPVWLYRPYLTWSFYIVFGWMMALNHMSRTMNRNIELL